MRFAENINYFAFRRIYKPVFVELRSHPNRLAKTTKITIEWVAIKLIRIAWIATIVWITISNVVVAMNIKLVAMNIKLVLRFEARFLPPVSQEKLLAVFFAELFFSPKYPCIKPLCITLS
jgi:hypothetical protein